MRNLLLLYVLLACSPALAADDDIPVVPVVPEIPQGIVLQKQADGRWLECRANVDCSGIGVRGIWWPVTVAEQLAKEHLEIKELRPKAYAQDVVLGLYKERITLAKERYDIADREAKELDNIVHLLGDDVVRAELKAHEAEMSLGAWYRNPVLWFGIGAITTAILSISLVVAN